MEDAHANDQLDARGNVLKEAQESQWESLRCLGECDERNDGQDSRSDEHCQVKLPGHRTIAGALKGVE